MNLLPVETVLYGNLGNVMATMEYFYSILVTHDFCNRQRVTQRESLSSSCPLGAENTIPDVALTHVWKWGSHLHNSFISDSETRTDLLIAAD